MQLSCEHCLWWQQESGGVQVQGANSFDHGRCHRFPPPKGEFPLLHRTAFCGEFTPRTYASVARLAGGSQFSHGAGAPQDCKSIETNVPPSPTGEVLSGETAAIIAAAVAMVLPGPHRIISAQSVPPASFGPWPLGAVLNTWAVEGRVQHFSSHRLR